MPPYDWILPVEVFAALESVDRFIDSIKKPDANAAPISTAAELAAMNLNGSYYLTNDIDLSNYGLWKSAGMTSSNPFTGTSPLFFKTACATINISLKTYLPLQQTERDRTMKRNIRRAAAHVGLLCGLLCLLWLLLSCSAMLPNDALHKNFEQSALSYAQADAFHFHNGDKWNAIADNYADAILLNVAWHMGTGNPFSAAIDTGYYDGEELGGNMGLYLSVTEGMAPNTDYTRYWHGSVMFLRPLHLFTDVDGIKALGFATILGLLALTMGLLIRKKHTDLAILLALSLAAVQVWNLRLSLEYQTAFIVAFALCPLYLWLERKGDQWLPLLSVAGGTAIAFFDFLTTETLTLLLPLLLVVTVRAREGRLAPLRESLLLLLQCALCWGGAYAGTFLVKWTAASLVTGENAFALALASAAERVGGAVALETGTPSSIFSAIAANLTVVFGGTARVQMNRVILGLGVYLGLLGSLWYLFRRKDGQRGAALLLLLLGAVVFLRYLVMNNHSYLHEFLTYRALAAPILATLLALRLNVGPPGNRRARR